MTDNDEQANKSPGADGNPSAKDGGACAPGLPANPKSNPDDDEKQSPPDRDPNEEHLTLQEELQIEDLSRCIYFKDNKLFAAAGPGIPLLQVNTDGTFVSLSPDLPYRQQVDKDVVVEWDEHGRLVDALGQTRKVTGMKYKGQQLYYVNKKHPDNDQPLAAWFDDDWKQHYLYLRVQDQNTGEVRQTILSGAMVVKIRHRMIDGELSTFEELVSD